MNRLRRMIFLALLGSLIAALSGLWPMGAAGQQAATVLQVDSMPMMDERGNELPGKYWILATLTTEDGRYLGNRPLQIVEPIDFFGRREAMLGTALTDGTGMAAVTYQPSQDGNHLVVVRFRGDSEYSATKSQLEIVAADVISPFAEEALPLASVGTALAIVLAFLGIAFWAVLLGVMGGTAWRIQRAPRLQHSSSSIGGKAT
jgi:hypothetical protein